MGQARVEAERRKTALDAYAKRVDRNCGIYEDVLDWVAENFDEDEILSLTFDMFGHPSVNLMAPTVKAANAIIADVVRKFNLKITNRPEGESVARTWYLKPNTEALVLDDLLFTISPRSCRLEETGEVETITRPIRKVVCDEPE